MNMSSQINLNYNASLNSSEIARLQRNVYKRIKKLQSDTCRTRWAPSPELGTRDVYLG